MRIIFTARKIGSFEFMVSLGIIFTVTSILLIYISQLITKSKEMVLVAGLRNIRIALDIYKGFNDKYPEDIRELVEQEIFGTKLIHEMYKKPYLQHQRMDREGFPVDPWGNRFVYEPESGKINSQTKGYQDL